MHLICSGCYVLIRGIKQVFNNAFATSPEKALDLLKACIHEALHSGSAYKLPCFRLAVLHAPAILCLMIIEIQSYQVYFATRLYVRSCGDETDQIKETIVDVFRPLIEMSFQKKNAPVNSQFLEFVFERTIVSFGFSFALNDILI